MNAPYYQDNYVTIYHGDSQEILPELPKADLVLTDPPYGINENHKKNNSRGRLAKSTDYGDYEWDKKPAPENLINACLNNSINTIIWGGNFFHLPPSPCWLVWDKKNGNNDFADCELAWTNLNAAVRKFEFMWNGMLRDGEARNKKRVHPTQKPLELMTWCISRIKDCNSIIDPFMGSGTTLRAAKDLNRKAIGIEIEEKYCEIAAQRCCQEVLPLF